MKTGRQPGRKSVLVWMVAAVGVIAGVAIISSPQWLAGRQDSDPHNVQSAVQPPRPTVTPSTSVAFLPRPDQESWQEMDDPHSDGWDTEAYHAKVKKQLAQLGALLVQPRSATAESLASLVTPDFSGSPLVPGKLERVFEDGTLLVQRARSGDVPGLEVAGAEGLAEAIRQVAKPLLAAEDARFKFKVIRVDLSREGGQTRQYLSVAGRTPDGIVEQHATWVTSWVDDPESTLPKLQSIQVEEFEQTSTLSQGRPLFADCTEAALANNACYSEQMLRGLNHWLQRIPFRTMLNLFSLPGIAVGDVNADGLDDLYLCQDPGLPNRLFLQNPDGTLRDVSKQWGVDWLEDARGALLVDLDSDGDQDLVVAVVGSLVVATNEEGRRFRLGGVLPVNEDVTSLCAFDYDLDGRLDLYACVYQRNQLLRDPGDEAIGAARSGFVYHDANDGGANSLFRNETASDGEWKFVDVTEQVGLDENNVRWSFAASAEDFDNDGDQDLYVANDYGRDNLYRNELAETGQPVFVDVSDAAGVEDRASGMGITWSDFDRDGWMDTYVSNMFSAAGSRITSLSRFRSRASEQVRQRLQHFVVGNTLMRNLGNGTFQDVTAAAGVGMGRWAWGNHFFDLNNDGWDDMIVANGYMTTDDTGDL